MEIKEIWKDLIGYENHYQVSNLGNIRSIKIFKTNNIPRILNLKPTINSRGYLTVNLHKGKGFKPQVFKLHRLIISTFKENHNNLEIINHIDNNQLNNNINNLEWVSHRENTSHYHSLRNDTSSKFIGVSFTKGYNKWRSFISFKDKVLTIGHFNNEIEAHNARINYENDNNIINKYS